MTTKSNGKSEDAAVQTGPLLLACLTGGGLDYSVVQKNHAFIIQMEVFPGYYYSA